MIQTQPMLEECGVQHVGPDGGCGGSGEGMVGAAPLHHHPNHPHPHQPNHHHPQVSHHHHHTPGGVYMKPVYNLSSLCHQGPLTPPGRMASPTSQTPSSVSPPSGPLHHLPVYHHGTGGAETGSGAPTNGHPGHFRPAQLSVPVFPAKRLRGGDHHHPHPQHPHHTEMLRCKRRVDLSLKLGYKTHPTAVARRNERERNRVKHINSTFSTLRQHIPCAAKNKKMSKVETLRSAIRYINHLQQILETQKAQEEAELEEADRGEGEGEQDGGAEHQRHPHHQPRHIRHHLQHHSTLHLFSPGGSSSIGSPGADTTSATTRLDCDVTAVRMRSSSVLLSPPGSPTSCDGRPGSADSHDLSPRRHYDYVTALHDDDDVDDDVDNDVDADDDDPHDLSQFGDWF